MDPWFIVEQTPDLAKLIHTARLVNDGKPRWVIEQVKAAAKGLSNPKVACLGLSFKPDIDDLRESPALEISAHLAHEIDGLIYAVEPHVESLPPALSKYRNVEFMQAEAAIADADIVLLLVNHKAFLTIDRTLLAGKVVIDTRGAWR